MSSDWFTGYLQPFTHLPPPPASFHPLDIGVSDADLEAELLALEGKSPSKGGKKSSKSGGNDGMMSMDELDKVMASAGKMGEDDDYGEEEEELSDMDDDELLGELKVRGGGEGGEGGTE